MTNGLPSSLAAIHDFRRARQRANLDNIIGNLTGRHSELLSFDEVRHQLKGSVSGTRRLEDVPLESIVGSVGRYSDFNRQFLPQKDSDEMRWSRVKSNKPGSCRARDPLNFRNDWAGVMPAFFIGERK